MRATIDNSSPFSLLPIILQWPFSLFSCLSCVPLQFNLGCMYEHGRGVAKDTREAVAWYYKAAKNQEEKREGEGGMEREGREGEKRRRKGNRMLGREGQTSEEQRRMEKEEEKYRNGDPGEHTTQTYTHSLFLSLSDLVVFVLNLLFLLPFSCSVPHHQFPPFALISLLFSNNSALRSHSLSPHLCSRTHVLRTCSSIVTVI